MIPTIKFYNCLVLLLLGTIALTPRALSAQDVVVQESFEYDCSAATSNAFYNGCFEGWTSSHGTPNVQMSASLDGGGTLSAHDGSWFMHGYIKYGICNIMQSRGEGIALNYDFQAGATYRLSYAYVSTGPGSNHILNRTRVSQWLLSDGYPNISGYPCTDNEYVPPVNEPTELVHTPTDNGGSWQFYNNVEFTPGQDFGQLWFRSEYQVQGANSQQAHGDFYIDNLTIELICDPTGNTPVFNFEKENGYPTNEFCFSENVFMDATANTDANRFRIEIKRRMAGSNDDYEAYGNYGWRESTPGLINLSALWAQQTLPFEPGYEYQVFLYTGDGDCVQEIPAVHTFTLECCEEFSANFLLNLIEQEPGNLTLTVSGYEDDPALNLSHEWIVLSSPNEDVGPYAVETTLTTTGSGTITLLENLQSSFYYTVIHRLQTPCGEFCLGKQRFGQNGAAERTEDPNDPTCEFCGPFACELLEELCMAPTGLYVRQTGNGIMIDWDDHLTADQYTVQITLNDPDCCGENQQVIVASYDVEESELFIPYFVNCMSVQVGVVCGESYEWSDEVCFYYHRTQLNSSAAGTAEGTERLQGAKAYPNPVNDVLNVGFDVPFTGEISVYDLHGRVVLKQGVADASVAQLDLSALSPGMYWMTYSNDEVTSKPLRVVKASSN